jgi:hypothetical protein
MKCPRCQQDNPPQAKFCLECPGPLAPRCANCGSELPAGAKFCFDTRWRPRRAAAFRLT